jgi:hypothetical protein
LIFADRKAPKFDLPAVPAQALQTLCDNDKTDPPRATIAPPRSVDAALHLAFTARVSSRSSLGGVGVRVSSLFRVFCAVVLAVVTTFHVCDAASARDIGPSPIVHEASDTAHQAGDIDVTAEKCHLCTVVSLPAALAGGATLAVLHVVPTGGSADLTSLSPSATSPPPRTLT